MSKIPSEDFWARASSSFFFATPRSPARSYKKRGDVVNKNRSAGRKDIPSLGKRRFHLLERSPALSKRGKIELKRGFLSGEINSVFLWQHI